MMRERPRQTWLEAEPERARRERETMGAVAPEMAWLDEARAGGWEGIAPIWPIPRPEPAGVSRLLQGRRLRLRVEYSQGYPMVEPKLIPLNPDVPIERRILHSWHVKGDGSLCLLQTASQWTGRDTAADLVVKASGWFIEYLLFDAGAIETMTERGLHADDSRDAMLAEWGG